MPIEIVEPRQDWPDEFQRLKPSVLAAAPQGAILHHIGSTAVAGLPAKDVIDMQLTVADLAAVDIAAFERAGFRRSLVVADHGPPGLSIDPAELQKLLFKTVTERPANIHVRRQGRYNQRYALVCRDFLRSHAVTVAAYGRIKQRLAAFFPDDEEAYYDIKDPVFDIIVDGAEEWANATGWRQPPGD